MANHIKKQITVKIYLIKNCFEKFHLYITTDDVEKLFSEFLKIPELIRVRTINLP